MCTNLLYYYVVFGPWDLVNMNVFCAWLFVVVRAMKRADSYAYKCLKCQGVFLQCKDHPLG